MILDALVSLVLHAEPLDSQRTPTSNAVSANADRDWVVNRPNRGAHSRTVALAALPPKGWERFAACVINRESHGYPGVLNGEGSGAAGLVQFMPDWRHGLPYIVRERLIQFGMPKALARSVRVYLSRLHYIDRYPEVYQRIGFAEVLEDGEWHHWSGGHGCNALVPA